MRMTLAQVKEAVLSGRTVHVGKPAYKVVVDSQGEWLIVCSLNGYTIGLTWLDGVTVNARPEDFFIAPGMPGMEVVC